MDAMLRRRLMMQPQAGGRIPSDYQEVEWIKPSASGAYINTGVLQGGGVGVKTRILYGGVGTSYYFGAILGGLRGIGFEVGRNVDKGVASIYCSSGKMEVSAAIIGYNTWYVVAENYLGDGKLTIDGDDYTGTAVFGAASNKEIVLCGLNINGTVRTSVSSIGETLLTDAAETTRDLVPCYRKSDNVVGMYDLAGSICPLTDSPFYTNAGSSSFLVGPDVI